MAAGVAAVWVPVTDMDRAVKFYRDVLGLKVDSQDDDWSEIDANGLKLGLNAREGASQTADGGAVITFQPDAASMPRSPSSRTRAWSSPAGSAITSGVASHRSRTRRATTSSSTSPRRAEPKGRVVLLACARDHPPFSRERAHFSLSRARRYCLEGTRTARGEGPRPSLGSGSENTKPRI